MTEWYEGEEEEAIGRLQEPYFDFSEFGVLPTDVVAVTRGALDSGFKLSS